MVFQFGFLGFFKGEKHAFREKDPVIVGTAINLNTLRNNIVFDTEHGSLTGGTKNGLVLGKKVFGSNRVDIFGNFRRSEVG